jgi:subtilisin family serine protease
MKYLNAITLLTFGWMPSLSAQVLTHRKLQRLPQSQVIPGQYVIELDPSIPDSQGFAEKVLKRTFRKNIIETYDYAMKGFAVKDVPDMVLNFILNMDDVLSVSEDGIVEIEAIQNNPTWGLDLVDGSDDNRYTYTYTGRGVDVYIVDTGIQANHPDFEGRVRSCVSYTGECKFAFRI